MAVPSKYIQIVQKAAKGRPRSTAWYRDKIAEFGKPTAMQLIKDGKRNTTPFYGKLDMFFYYPKLKSTLPYYDRFPLVLPMQGYGDGFLGINLHYLPIPLRIRLLDKSLHYKLLLLPDLYFGEAYTDGSLVIENGSITEEELDKRFERK